eukprot:3932346-Rhodomonas_salina.1
MHNGMGNEVYFTASLDSNDNSEVSQHSVSLETTVSVALETTENITEREVTSESAVVSDNANDAFHMQNTSTSLNSELQHSNVHVFPLMGNLKSKILKVIGESYRNENFVVSALWHHLKSEAMEGCGLTESVDNLQSFVHVVIEENENNFPATCHLMFSRQAMQFLFREGVIRGVQPIKQEEVKTKRYNEIQEMIPLVTPMALRA